METIIAKVLDTYAGRQLFACVEPNDLHRTLAQIVQFVAGETKNAIERQKRKQNVLARTFVMRSHTDDGAERMAEWVNGIAQQYEIVKTDYVAGDGTHITAIVTYYQPVTETDL